jgi:hypothetical protein
MVLTGREKATIFLSILGADVSSRVLRYLPDELADLIAAGINHLPSPSPEALAEVLGEYNGFLALPAAGAAPVYEPVVQQPKKNFAPLFYERPQVAAFIMSLLPENEREAAWRAFPKNRAAVEELILTLKETPLQPRLEEQLRQQFAGTIF